MAWLLSKDGGKEGSPGYTENMIFSGNDGSQGGAQRYPSSLGKDTGRKCLLLLVSPLVSVKQVNHPNLLKTQEPPVQGALLGGLSGFFTHA